MPACSAPAAAFAPAMCRSTSDAFWAPSAIPANDANVRAERNLFIWSPRSGSSRLSLSGSSRTLVVRLKPDSTYEPGTTNLEPGTWNRERRPVLFPLRLVDVCALAEEHFRALHQRLRQRRMRMDDQLQVLGCRAHLDRQHPFGNQ